MDGMAHASVLASRPLGGMVPDPALLTPAHETELIRADGRPQPAFREQLRKIPSWRNAWSVLSVWLQAVADPRPRGLVGEPGRLRRRLSPHGSHAGAARVADARVGPPVAVRQPPAQRLRRSLAARLPRVHVDRRVPARAHGAPPSGIRARRAGHPAVRRLSDHPGELPPQAGARRDRADRVQALPRPGRRLPLVRPPCPAHAVEDPLGAGGPARRRDRRPGTGGCTRCSGCCRSSPCGG